MSDANNATSTEHSLLPGAFCSLFGLYLFIGGCYAIFSKKWPIFLPPQFDGISMLLNVFGEQAAVYIAGGISCLLGALFGFAGIVLCLRNDA